MNKQHFVDGYLLYLMAAASERASASFHAIVRQHGLRVVEWRVLACLSDRTAIATTELAEKSLCEQSRMTRILDQMVEKGLLERSLDNQDRRRIRVSLTQDGQNLADILVAAARAHEARLLAELADTDAARIKPMLEALLKQLSQLPQDHR